MKLQYVSNCYNVRSSFALILVHNTLGMQALEDLLSEVGPEEAPYQPGYQMTDLRHLFSTTFHHTEKRLSMLRARIQKHLNNSPDVMTMVHLRPPSTVLCTLFQRSVLHLASQIDLDAMNLRKDSPKLGYS